MKNVEFVRTVVVASQVEAIKKLKLRLGGAAEPDYDVLRAIETQVLRGENKTAPGISLIDALVEFTMEWLGHTNVLKGNGSQTARAVRRRLGA